MALFPWEMASSPITEMQNCKHCGQAQPVERGRVIVCQCPEAVREQQEERQRRLNWQREQEERRNG
jgi:hypothetical protein